MDVLSIRVSTGKIPTSWSEVGTIREQRYDDVLPLNTETSKVLRVLHRPVSRRTRYYEG